MSTTVPPPPPAWEPLTPQGVAAFASGSFGRLFLVQLIVAVLATVVVVWVLHADWFPVIREAVRQLPDKGEVRNAQLDWHGTSPARLAGNHKLGFSVDLTHSGTGARDAQLQVEFGRADVRVYLLVHYWVIEYPDGWRIAFNRTELEPWWGAWEPGLLAITAGLVFVGLLVVWTGLATLYCVPTWLIAFFENRDLNLRQSWRLSGAALMPGAMFLTAGILSYGLNVVDLLQLAVLGGLHVMIGWIYLALSPLFLARNPAASNSGRNPFAKRPTGSKEADGGRKP
ncbi:MAG TPA: hypothetical protein VN281_09150 [Verrucomicrobiae bacterium]|jgi:hypothetical protein|nr:hypothetical protein [Verrucomicrobiae bacterium]